MPFTDQGLAELFDDLRAEAAAAGPYWLDVLNDTRYAEHVQDREGYDVVSQAGLEAARDREIDVVIGAGVPLTKERVVVALDKAGGDEVRRLRSYTGETTDDGRPRHPGHWADDEGVLVDNYEHGVYPPGTPPPGPPTSEGDDA